MAGLLGLLVLWGLLLFGGFAFGRPDPTGSQRMPLWTRIGSSVVLVVAGWIWYWFSRGTGASSFALLIATGMTLGLVGDLFMAELLPLTQPVMGGIGAFGLGHVAYIAACLLFAHRHGLDAPGPRWRAWVVWLLIGVVGWYLVVFRGQQPTTLHWAALPYSLLLASTAGFATGLALQAPAFTQLALGAALFLASDLILAARLFSNLHFPLINDVVWLTYGPGQMLIVYSVARALQFLGRG
jgi:phosphoglycerol transferase MdoB-like AlkP superfamily enzyme